MLSWVVRFTALLPYPCRKERLVVINNMDLIQSSRFGLAQALPSAYQAAILSLDAANQQRFVLSIMLIVTMQVFLWRYGNCGN